MYPPSSQTYVVVLAKRGVQAPNNNRRFKSVVAVHLMECQEAFAVCAATAQPYQSSTALMAKAAPNLSIFVTQFSKAVMEMRAGEKKNYTRENTPQGR
jgi:hypothetical protein